MGLIYADIELINGYDLENVRRNIMGAEEVRRVHVNALVDSGAHMMCINEHIQEMLQFPVDETRWAVTADGRRVECLVVKGVEVRFKNRKTTCRAIVLPGDNEPLLGAIPLEDMDVLIHPLRQELIVNPEFPDTSYCKIKKVRRLVRA